jgi:hypothetical protein
MEDIFGSGGVCFFTATVKPGRPFFALLALSCAAFDQLPVNGGGEGTVRRGCEFLSPGCCFRVCCELNSAFTCVCFNFFK